MGYTLAIAVFAASLASSAAASVATDSGSAQSFLQDYDSGTVARRAELEAFVAGFSQGLTSANAWLMVHKLPPLYCQSNFTLTADQVIEILRQDRDDQSQIVGAAITFSLQKTFPCK